MFIVGANLRHSDPSPPAETITPPPFTEIRFTSTEGTTVING